MADADPRPEPAVEFDFDPADMSPTQVEQRLRDVIAWARAKRTDQTDPVAARAASLIVTHVEDALLRLLRPVP